MTRPDANEPKRTSKDSAPTAEYPAYARGAAPPQEQGADWPDEADDIGQPLDTGRFRDATRMELTEPRRGGGWRGLLWLAAVIALVGALLFGVRSVGLWPDFNNPFAEKQTDRSQPVLLKSIQDLSRFTAASGNFEVVIDVQNNRNLIPDFIYNERTLFVAAGSVDAYVDFARVTEDGLKVDPEAKTVEVRLPAAQLEKPNINNERSYVFATQRGLVNRIGDVFGGDPNKQRQLYIAAETKIGEAAKGSGLVERAQENTTKMLDQMLRALGYTTIKITYVAP
ncbi:MAG TPA: DUF4230 domain-containing protein [Micromonosporaceae bacterium]|nr:DUF4230 domain-containing protein [Micromonosporaceae bacterium]